MGEQYLSQIVRGKSFLTYKGETKILTDRHIYRQTHRQRERKQRKIDNGIYKEINGAIERRTATDRKREERQVRAT